MGSGGLGEGGRRREGGTTRQGLVVGVEGTHMTSRSDCEPLPKPTLSPFALLRARVPFSVSVFFTAAVHVVCACSLGGYRWFIL